MTLLKITNLQITGFFLMPAILTRIPKRVLGCWLEKNERIAEFTIKTKNTLLLICGICIACAYISIGSDEYNKFMQSYKSPHQQRLEFLQNNCKLIDIGYEILNNGKSTYKFRNVKEYNV